MHIIKNIVYFPMDVSNKIDVTYNKDLKNLLAIIYNNDKYETMVKIQQPLVKEENYD